MFGCVRAFVYMRACLLACVRMRMCVRVCACVCTILTALTFPPNYLFQKRTVNNCFAKAVLSQMEHFSLVSNSGFSH